LATRVALHLLRQALPGSTYTYSLPGGAPLFSDPVDDRSELVLLLYREHKARRSPRRSAIHPECVASSRTSTPRSAVDLSPRTSRSRS
jgi:hypothetical protein